MICQTLLIWTWRLSTLLFWIIKLMKNIFQKLQRNIFFKKIYYCNCGILSSKNWKKIAKAKRKKIISFEVLYFVIFRNKATLYVWYVINHYESINIESVDLRIFFNNIWTSSVWWQHLLSPLFVHSIIGQRGHKTKPNLTSSLFHRVYKTRR